MDSSAKVSRRVRELGLQQVATIDSKNVDVCRFKAWLANYPLNMKYADDMYVWLACVLALKAVSSGNFGVGCILVDHRGDVVVQAYNQVFNPYFRSDRHAEMVAMDEFEDARRKLSKLEGHVLYTSLELCPMCLSRLITSGVEMILYAAPDTAGGMVHKMKDLPPIWIELAKGQIFGQAKCSQDLVDAAMQLFLLNANELNEKLKNR